MSQEKVKPEVKRNKPMIPIKSLRSIRKAAIAPKPIDGTVPDLLVIIIFHQRKRNDFDHDDDGDVNMNQNYQVGAVTTQFRLISMARLSFQKFMHIYGILGQANDETFHLVTKNDNDDGSILYDADHNVVPDPVLGELISGDLGRELEGEYFPAIPKGSVIFRITVVVS